MEETPEQLAQVLAGVPGGSELLAWFGRLPSFHDGEVLGLHLDRDGPSVLRIHTWNTASEIDEHGFLVRDKHAVVTFVFQRIVDLQLEGFGSQNVVGGLVLRRAPERPERLGYFDPSPDDYEIELQPCYGLNGWIRARGVRVGFTPGRPDKIE